MLDCNFIMNVTVVTHTAHMEELRRGNVIMFVLVIAHRLVAPNSETVSMKQE